MSNFEHLASSKLFDALIDYSKSNLHLFSDYGLSYMNSVLNSLNLQNSNNYDDKGRINLNSDTNGNSVPIINPISYYFHLLSISNSEFNKILHSKDSLQHFRDHINSIVNLETSIRQNPPFFPFFSIVDSVIDKYYIMFHKTVVSINETPHKLVRQMDATRLLRYNSTEQNTMPPLSGQNSNATTSAAATPLLMIYAPINRYHILDLSPERSVVQKFVSAGFDVFLLDWGEKQNENKPTLADYVEYIDQSVEQIRKITNQEKTNLYGYSWGGTLSIMYASIHSSKIKNMVLQSANFDFDKDDTVIAEWMRNFPVERFVDEFKEMFGHFIDLAFLMRNPIAHGLDYLKYALETREDFNIKFIENLVKIRSWINNTPDIPGPLFKRFVVDLYRQNLLIKNQLILNGDENKPETETETGRRRTAIDIKNITMPVLNIVGKEDDLVSPKSSVPITMADGDTGGAGISSKDKMLIELPSDHIQICIGYDAHKNLWPKVAHWLKERQ